MLTQFLEQLWAKHHVAIFTSLATLDVNYHALTVDVRDFQVGQLGAPHSGSVERHQQRAMEGSASRIDESRHFFLAHDRGNMLGSFRIRGLGYTPASLESLRIEEPKSAKIVRHGARRQLSLLEQFRLVFANLLGAQAVWRTMEALREIFHYPDVTVYGSFGIITTLEIFQHHFSEMGHGTPPVTHTYIKPSSNQRSTTSRVASAAGWLRSSPLVGSHRIASDWVLGSRHRDVAAGDCQFGWLQGVRDLFREDSFYFPRRC